MPIKLHQIVRNTLFVLLLILVFLYVFAESNYIQNKNIPFIQASLSELIVSSLGLVLMLWAFPTKSRTKWLQVCLISIKSILIFTILFMVFSEAAIVDFSGMLFGPEAIVHFSWDAFVLGVNEYLWLFLALLLFLTLAILILVYSSHTLLSNKTQWWVFIIAFLMFSFAFEHSILGRYAKGIGRFMDLNHLQAVSEKGLIVLEPLGIAKLTVTKSGITASQGNNKNLIVIYLESFSDIFTTSTNYPNLTPNINRLKSEYVSFSPYISTAKFTMDGLIGSLCGFLPNMTLGNNAITESEKNYYFIPCMTDVLKHAGYHQEFIGGAKKSFAGKGAFLLDHGYDQVWGWEDFENQEPTQIPVRKNWWGLHDDDLFNFVESRVKELRKGEQPFHLSMITLATHLKGFPAPTCQPYNSDADQYINAIHCTDQLLGQFINQLKTAGLLEDTVVFITGDHGVFSTSLTKDLFGNELKSQHIFGLIIDKAENNNNFPMALYDMAPVLLDRLKIKHNVTFINGQSNPFSSERLLLTTKGAYQNGEPVQLNHECHGSEVLDPENLSVCTHEKSINTLHGYTQLFNLNTSIKYQAGSSLKVIYSEDESSIKAITLNGNSITNHFTKDGFRLQQKNFNTPDIFYIQFDTETKTLSKTFLLNSSKNPFDIIYYLHKESDLPFIVFGIEHAFDAEFKQHLKHLNPSACLNDQFCYYQLDNLGKLEQNPDHTEISLTLNQ